MRTNSNLYWKYNYLKNINKTSTFTSIKAHVIFPIHATNFSTKLCLFVAGCVVFSIKILIFIENTKQPATNKQSFVEKFVAWMGKITCAFI
jgi:hypothetical protein